MPIQDLIPGPVNSLCWGSVGQNASLYAVGIIEFDGFDGIAGCNEDGIWVDTAFGGPPNDLELTQIVYLNGK